jgi:hypothetical protein
LIAATSNNGNFSATNPTSRIVTSSTAPTVSVSRSWTDGNRNFAPDCDLLNPLAQDFRASGGDSCGQISNLNFGKNVFSNTYDPAILEGWGIRPWDWSFGASLQQEVLPRVSVEAGYYRRWFGNFTVTDNLSVASSDYSPFSITAPADPRLPGGGGNVIAWLYDVSPALFGATNNYLTDPGNYGKQTQYWHGVDVNLNARLPGGVTVQGGTSTGRQVTDSCEIRAKLPETATLNPYCHVAEPFLTRVTGLATYIIPRADVQVSGAFQSKPGGLLAANYNVPNSVVAASLGRNLAGGTQNVPVNLVEPGSLLGDRINQLDLRVAKILKFGRTRTNVGIDLYNALNSAAVLTYNQTFIPGGSWLTPTSVLSARFARISAQVDF